MSKKDDGSMAAAREAREAEAARQAKVRQGTEEIDKIFNSSFNDDTFTNLRDGYTSYAMPQLDEQFGDAKKMLVGNLARRGLLESSARTEGEADLSKQYEAGARQIGSDALGWTSAARDQIESARSRLIGDLSATGDVDRAVNSARSSAQDFMNAQPQYSPLASMFQLGSELVADQARNEKLAAVSQGMYKPRYDTGLFANTGSVEVR